MLFILTLNLSIYYCYLNSLTGPKKFRIISQLCGKASKQYNSCFTEGRTMYWDFSEEHFMKSHISYWGLQKTVMRFKDWSIYSFRATEISCPWRIYYKHRNAITNSRVQVDVCTKGKLEPAVKIKLPPIPEIRWFKDSLSCYILIFYPCSEDIDLECKLQHLHYSDPKLSTSQIDLHLL